MFTIVISATAPHDPEARCPEAREALTKIKRVAAPYFCIRRRRGRYSLKVKQQSIDRKKLIADSSQEQDPAIAEIIRPLRAPLHVGSMQSTPTALRSAMTKAAIYARYSTELQSESSIDDQVALWEGYAARERLEVVRRFSDRARSSASLKGRDGIEAMMTSARSGDFSVLIVASPDRISRGKICRESTNASASSASRSSRCITAQLITSRSVYADCSVPSSLRTSPRRSIAG